MTTTRDLLQRVDAALATADESQTEVLRGLADQVATSSTRLLVKVGTCESLWRQGRFDEARQAASRGGDLREESELLTFKSADSWSGWCRRLGLPVPVPADAQKLRFLLERLSAGPSKLEQLLREYRRFVLGRAPLIDRLRLLRAIAKADPDNAGWLDDIRAFEQARHDELAKVIREAEARGDAAQLRALKDELTTAPWVVPPPPRLLPQVKAALDPLEARATERRYEELAANLRDAHAALDEGRCRRVIEEWDALAATSRVPDPSNSASDLAPVRLWLKDLEDQRAADRAFDDACAELERALDAGAALEEIERLGAAVLRHDRGMPPVLGTRAASRLDELRAAARARSVLRLVAVVACALLVGGAVAFSWQQHARATTVAQWATHVNTAIEADDLDAARALLTELHEKDAAAFGAPEIQELDARLLAREKAEAERLASFAASIAALESAGVADVDFDSLLKRVDVLARTATERAAVDEWAHRRIVHMDEQRRFRDQALAPEFARLERDFDDLRAAHARDAAEVQDRAEKCADLARRLAATGDASPRLRERATTIAAAIAAMQREALERSERQREIAGELIKIERAATAEALVGALVAFSKAFPDHPRSVDFVRAASQADMWRAVDAWRTMITGLGRTVRVEGRSTATSRLALVQQHLSRHPSSPLRADAERLEAYYSRAVAALEESGPQGLEVLRSVLESPLISRSFMVEDREQRRYYTFDDEPPAQPRQGNAPLIYAFEYVINARLVTRKRVWNTATDGGVAEPRRSPQSKFAEAAEKILSSPTDRAWETVYLRLIEAVLAEGDMDPILAASLVRLLCDLARSTVPFATEDVQGFDSELRSIRVEVAWMDPDNEEAGPIRARARAALDRLPRIRSVIARVQEQLRPPLVLWPAGVYLREIKLAPGVTRGELYVLADGAPRKIGKVAAGAVEVEAPALLGQTPQGSLVFFTKD